MGDATGAAAGLRLAVLTRAIAPLHGVGGLERATQDLVRHLLDRGAAVTVLTRPPTAAAPWSQPGLSFRFVPYVTFPFAGRRGTTILDRSTAYPVFGFRLGRLAARAVRAREVDLVYGLGASTLGYAIARRRAPGATAPLVMNPQGLEEFGGPDGLYGGRPSKRLGYGPLRAAVRYCAAAADRVIATDRSLEPLIARTLGVAADRVSLVPNAVDLASCDALASPRDGQRIRQARAIGPAELVLLSVARIERNKGLHVLADALASLADLPWRWVVVGDGPFRGALEARIAERGIGARTLLAGRVDDATLHAWYEAASLFVHPTQYEGSSIVTLEAMAHRLPVVASAAGGLPDKVRPGETGWLVPPGDAAGLAGALRAAMHPGAPLEAMGRAGRALVEAEFSWARSADRMLAVFGAIMREATIT
ncbi:MAG TPA: glycosyltransferase family 4 protein [Vicinamibacterales bacterium]|nr:glycosyltransferase family 4 protein [Vicinamibacterales bacterium]HOQ59582.1 glycosyltransferase family 4 protein [Vicinamibacterales bacterium]HPK71605.1 glycosyltransferase family 4 protein [Vicinamibacterales bacterium]